MPTYSIEQWARFALTGDMASASPTSPQLAPLVASVKRQLKAAHPCLGSDPDTTLTGDEEEAWSEWVGYLVAARYAGTPAGRTLTQPGTKTTVKLGPVTREVSGSAGSALTPADMLREGQAARLRISCIKGRLTATDTSGVMNPDLTGRRRTIGDAPTVAGRLLGLGED